MGAKETGGLAEIEVTEAMLEAGDAVLREHYLGDGVYDLRDGIMTEVYRAMFRRRPLPVDQGR
jgi:hypothetical protein